MFGSFNEHFYRTIWLLAAVACSWQTQAAETQYYQETPWELSLVADDSGAQNPYCALRTTIWERQSVSIEFTLTALDKVEIFVRLQKLGWNLPEGASTGVGLTSTELQGDGEKAEPVQFKAISSTDLYAPLSSQTRDGKFGLVLLFGLGVNKLTPIQAIFRFPGNEPEWTIPAASPSDYAALSSAYQACLIDLKKLGHHRFSSVETTSTSPFATVPEREAHATNDERPPGIWEFVEREEDWGDEDWGKACYVEVKKDKVTVGFAAHPGQAIKAFVKAEDQQPARAKWRIDANIAYSFEGEISDYFGWLGFDVPKPNIIHEIMQGQTLSVSIEGGATYSLDVSSAHEAFSQFLQCHS